MQSLDADAFVARDAPPALAADEIHVWLLTTDARLRPREVADAARRVLDDLLRGYADAPSTPIIERGTHGKPFAVDVVDLHFNLSHAGSTAVLAFARGQELGIDIERTDRRISVADIARRYFTAREADALLQLDPVVQPRAFLQLWTQKEAVLKALGKGLSFGLDRLCFSIAADGAVGGLEHIAAEAGSTDDWRLCRLQPAADLFGTLAWRGAQRRVRAFARAEPAAALRRSVAADRLD